MSNYYIGVDVGTGSVRAALVQYNGDIIKTSICPIKIWNPQKDFYEQSSNDIWKSCCKVVKEVSKGIDPKSIRGIGFDATCSLVCIGADDQPLTISLTGNDEQNIILWMDHRAILQAQLINEINPDVLQFVGGKISPEMQTPKLMWLKKNLNTTWSKAKYFFDLVDFLTWKATGDDSRSLCTVVCKWTFIAEKGNITGWDKKYFSQIGLEDLLANNASKIGSNVKIPGQKCGSGLTETAAKEFGLLPKTCVGVGLIDAHSGGLGLLTSFASGISSSFESKIGLICGTSSCHMVVSQTPKLVPGVWGPYFSAMIPNMYLNEAGQSATGKLIDFIIETHPAYSKIKSRMKDEENIYDYLNNLLYQMAASRRLKSTARLTSKLHIWPDFHGNRSPLADSSLLGMISGLSLAMDEEDLAVRYLASIQALAYGTRHILDTLRLHGHTEISTVLLCGGLSKNKLFVQMHADILGLPILFPKMSEPVLLGAAILGALASDVWPNVESAIEGMRRPTDIFLPSLTDTEYHLNKYKIYLKMVEDQKSYSTIMKNVTDS